MVREALIEFDAQHAARVKDARTFVDAIDAAHEELLETAVKLASFHTALADLSRIVERDHAPGSSWAWKDHACRECEGTIPIQGFQCARHRALSLLGNEPKT